MWNQIYYTVKRFFLDWRPMAIMLGAYILITFILGNAFSSAFETLDLEVVNALYVNEDSGEYGKQFIAQLKEQEEIKDLMELTEEQSFDAAEKKIRDEKADVLIYLSKDFSAQCESQDESNIVEVYRSKYSGMKATVTQSIVESYVSGLNAAGAVYKEKGNLEGFAFLPGTGIEKQPLVKEEKTPSAMGYYAIAMVLMMLLACADYGNIGISEDYLGAIGDRMRLSQVKPYQQFIGKIIGVSLVQLIQGGILIAFTKFVYGVSWGGNVPVLLAVVYSFCVLSTTFGGMLAMLCGDEQKASTMVTSLMIVFTFLSGGFMPADFGPLRYLSLSAYAQTSLTNLAYQGDGELVVRNIAFMWGFSIIFMLVSVRKIRRERA